MRRAEAGGSQNGLLPQASAGPEEPSDPAGEPVEAWLRVPRRFPSSRQARASAGEFAYFLSTSVASTVRS
jgi:hypothetical protein